MINNAAMNTGLQLSLQDSDLFSFGGIPSSGTAGSYSNSIFNFLRNCQTVFHSGYTSLHSQRTVHKGSLYFGGFFLS